MQVNSTADQPVGKAIYEFVIEAKRKTDSRSEIRFPFFRRAFITAGGSRYAAFTREISESGIGLLHHVELAPGEIDVTILSDNNPVWVQMQIVWCEPCGHGWYISGGQFVGV
jgi:PilZ domain